MKAFHDNKKNSIAIMEERQKIRNTIVQNKIELQKER